MRIFVPRRENLEKHCRLSAATELRFIRLVKSWFYLWSFGVNLIGILPENNQNRQNQDTIGKDLDSSRGKKETNLTRVHFSREIPRRCVPFVRIRDADATNRRVSFRFRGLPGRAFVRSLYYCQYWLCWLTLEHSLRQPAPASCHSVSHRCARNTYVRDERTDRDFPSAVGEMGKKAATNTARWFRFIQWIIRVPIVCSCPFKLKRECVTGTFCDLECERERPNIQYSLTNEFPGVTNLHLIIISTLGVTFFVQVLWRPRASCVALFFEFDSIE